MSDPAQPIVTVIQARTGSTRLPNKVLRPLAGKPLLTRMVERVTAAELAGTIVVATTTDSTDDPIATLCRSEGINCFRGHPDDLLDRHYRVGLEYSAATVIKIPSDCPLIDPAIIDRVTRFYLADPETYDYVSNLHPATFPDGNDVEVMTAAALEAAWREARRPLEREHTTPFLWENPDRFHIGNVEWEIGLDYSMTHRWTIDYEEDYQFISSVYDALYPANPAFGLADILKYLAENPQVAALNHHLAGVNWYRHHLDDLKTVSAAQTRHTG